MTEPHRYDLSKSEGFFKAFTTFTFFKEKGATIEIKEIQRTRTKLQNRALHLFFKFCSDALNDAGVEFQYRGLKGMTLEIPWNPDLFKSFIWKPIQIHMTGKESTTKLTTKEIDPILDVVIRHFAGMGLEVNFPNSFDYYLKNCY